MKRYAGTALLTFLLTGCVSSLQTLDIRRPLTPRELPTKETLDPRLLKSLRKTQQAIDSFNIKTYEKSTAWIPTEYLAEAITLDPENPFAWIQLGAQLTLDYQSDAAVRATEKGLAIIEARCSHTCTPDLEALRAVGSVNLAMIHASEDRPAEARLVLESVSAESLPDLDQLAYYWTNAYVSLQLGDVREARNQLFRASESVPEDLTLPIKQQVRRPHYVGNIRRANEHFLNAMIAAADGQPALADAEIDNAVRIFEGSWEAKILRTNLLMNRCEFDRSVDELEKLTITPRGMIFHPERIRFNLGNARVARYVDAVPAGQISDLKEAAAEFRRANEIVEERVGKARHRADSSDVIEKALTVSSIFLDALAEQRHVYADALNNLGDVELRLQSLEPGMNHAAEAERAWRQALSDFRWPRRDLAWSNLTRLYVSTRPRSALETAEEALEEDPYNIASLEALATFAARTADDQLAARISEGIARLVWTRRERYDGSTIDEDLLRPMMERLRARPASETRDRALLLIELITAPTVAHWQTILTRVRSQYPEWSWIPIQAALLNNSTDSSDADAEAGRLLAVPHKPGDWWQRQEQADAYILRARGEYENGRDELARRDIEAAVGYGAGTFKVEPLRDAVDQELREKNRPATRALAVLFFPTTYSEADQPSWSQSLPYAIAAALRAGSDASPKGSKDAPPFTVQYLDNQTLGITDDEAISPAEAGRRVHAGTVLSGRIATTSDKIIVDLTLTDSVSGTAMELGRTEGVLAKADLLTAAIVDRVLSALRLPPSEPGAAVVKKVFTANSEAYPLFLDGLGKLLDGERNEAEAAAPLTQATQKAPDFALAWAWLGDARFHRNETAGAGEAAQRALALNPSLPEALRLRAQLVTAGDDRIAALRSAVEVDAADANLRLLYAASLREHGRTEDALRESRAALQLAPYSAAAMVDLGWSLSSVGQFGEALQQAQDALERRPDFEPARKLLTALQTSRPKQ